LPILLLGIPSTTCTHVGNRAGRYELVLLVEMLVRRCVYMYGCTRTAVRYTGATRRTRFDLHISVLALQLDRRYAAVLPVGS
jgi:hypothetical protein